uniref:axin interactor, dorsalization-associated protein-like n=1 Tax=Halichoerus grypus TaxID=9711 RepID=UPI0016591D76|nr:axin interactor, dorsalization-associated protein-like [Halichoerus grypus]
MFGIMKCSFMVQSQELKLEDLKKLEPILKNITYNKEFPFDVQPVPVRKILAPGEEENGEFEEDEEEGGAGAGSPDSFLARVPGTFLPRLQSEPGITSLTIRIEKISLKDAGQCIDPYITVSLKDLNGIDELLCKILLWLQEKKIHMFILMWTLSSRSMLKN